PERLIERGELFHHDVHRPTIERDVVHRHDKDIPRFVQPQQTLTKDRTVLEIEDRVHLLGDDAATLARPFGVWQVRQIDRTELKRLRLMYYLHGFANRLG